MVEFLENIKGENFTYEKGKDMFLLMIIMKAY